MAQFDVYKNPGARTSKQAPYLIEVQGRFVEDLATCVVMPLVCIDCFTGATVLNPVISVHGNDFYLSPAEITSPYSVDQLPLYSHIVQKSLLP